MKKYIRYFCGFLESQENWLNHMSSKGYRLIGVGKLSYSFEECEKNKYIYAVDFVAHKSNAELSDYKEFLEDMNYRVLSKNANLNWSLGKIKLRPYGEGFGKIATSPGNYNKELLIVEKKKDHKPFELHTTTEDKLAYYKVQRNAYLSLFLLTAFLSIWTYFNSESLGFKDYLLFVSTVFLTIPTILLQKKYRYFYRKSKVQE